MFFREFMAKLEVLFEPSNEEALGDDLGQTSRSAISFLFSLFSPFESNKTLYLTRKGEKKIQHVELASRIL